MSEHEAKPFPLDFKALRKGDTITTTELERITGASRDSKRYDWELMKLCGEIEKRCAEEGNPVLPRVRQGQIVILNDAQADIELRKDHNCHVAGMRRALKRQVSVVSPSELNDEERRRHDHNIMVQSRAVQAVRKAARKLALPEPTKALPREQTQKVTEAIAAAGAVHAE